MDLLGCLSQQTIQPPSAAGRQVREHHQDLDICISDAMYMSATVCSQDVRPPCHESQHMNQSEGGSDCARSAL